MKDWKCDLEFLPHTWTWPFTPHLECQQWRAETRGGQGPTNINTLNVWPFSPNHCCLSLIGWPHHPTHCCLSVLTVRWHGQLHTDIPWMPAKFAFCYDLYWLTSAYSQPSLNVELAHLISQPAVCQHELYLVISPIPDVFPWGHIQHLIPSRFSQFHSSLGFSFKISTVFNVWKEPWLLASASNFLSLKYSFPLLNPTLEYFDCRLSNYCSENGIVFSSGSSVRINHLQGDCNESPTLSISCPSCTLW